MKNKRMKRILVWVILLALVIGQSNMVFAAKPDKPVQETSSSLDITSENLNLTVSEDQTIDFTINATTKEQYAIIWEPTTSDGGLLNLVDTSPPVAKPGKKVTAYLQDATFLFEPYDVVENKTVTYTIYAMKAVDDDLNKDSITVTITVTPVVTGNNPTIAYLALGDSIPYGRYYTSSWNYLFGGTDTSSYIEQFAMEYDVLNSEFDQSISGLNTIDIYNQLTPDKPGYNPMLVSQVEESDIITLCIGANDIMDAVPRTFYGLDKYNINWSVAENGRKSFETNWQKIIDRIHFLNYDVTLIVMTIYNPYHENESIYKQVDEYFSSDVEGDYGLNYIIKNTMSLYGADYSSQFTYLVADVYDTFNKYPNKDYLTEFYNRFSDPHPNQLGQNLIFNTHMDLFIDTLN